MRIGEFITLLVMAIAFLGLAVWGGDHVPQLTVPWLILVAVAWTLPGMIRRIQATGQEMMLVFLVTFLRISLPAADTPPLSAQTMAAMAVGAVIVEAVWAIQRFPRLRVTPEPFSAAVRSAVGTGLRMALGFSAWATLVVVVAAFASREAREAMLPHLPGIIGGYFGGALIGGTLYGLLHRLTGSVLGTMAVGIVVGTAIYGSVSPVVAAMKAAEGEPISLAFQAVIALGCGVLVGPVAALGLRHGPGTTH